MTPTIVFSIANILVVPMWILMVILPKWKATKFLMEYKVIPLLLALIYAVYIIQSLLTGGMLDFGSLAGAAQGLHF